MSQEKETEPKIVSSHDNENHEFNFFDAMQEVQSIQDEDAIFYDTTMKIFPVFCCINVWKDVFLWVFLYIFFSTGL